MGGPSFEIADDDEVLKFFVDGFDNVNKTSGLPSRFVHYTSVDAFLNILHTRYLWLRSTTLMNDRNEVTHGVSIVKQAIATITDEIKQKYIYDDEDVWSEAQDTFLEKSETLLRNTYINCISDFSDENWRGDLSMWRAYGGSQPIALVLNGYFTRLKSDHLATFTYPVIYKSDQDAVQMITRVLDEAAFLFDCLDHKIIDPADLTAGLSYVFTRAALTLKDPAFSDEREWRFVHQPLISASRHVHPIVISPNNTPQVAYSLCLEEEESRGPNRLEIAKLIQGIIIGPCPEPRHTRDALAHSLSAFMTLDEAYDRIRISDIPLRA